MTLVAAVLAAGTIVEKLHGPATAADVIYGSWWFAVLLGLVAVAAIVSIINEKMWHEPYRLLIYSSVVVILLGGGLSTWTGASGTMSLKSGESCDSFDRDGKMQKLPFSLTLDNFEIVTYPGSHAPMDFVSHLTADGEKVDISMNNIYRHRGYRFYQADYDDEGNSVLSVSHDPVGIAVTYAGYALLVIGLLLMFVSPKSHFRTLAKGASLAVLLMLSVSASATPQTLPRQTADRMGRIQVMYKGRVCPLQTVAKDFTTKLCGNATYHGLSPEQVLSGWVFYNSQWADEPMIKIKGGEVRQILGIDGRYTSFSNLLTHEKQLSSADKDKNTSAAIEKMNLVLMVENSKLLKIYPIADSLGNFAWYSQNDPLPLDVDDNDYIFVRKQLGYCQELVVKGDFATLDTVFAKTLRWQRKQVGDIMPSDSRIAAERLYNTLTTGRWLAMLIVALGILLFAFTIATSGSEGHWKRVPQIVSTVVVALLTLFLLLIIVLCWIVGGHAPMAGGFDSMNLMTVALGVVSLCVARRHQSAPAIALLAMGFCQLVAMMSGSNPPITHLMPVLNSPLLTLHVAVIMTAYALFLFIALSSVAALILPSQRERLERINLLMLYPAVALLSLGIIIGAVWANISWGNYWSWDPKEVWALITLLVYLFPLYQSRSEGHSRLFFHIYCVVAILSVAITYFGVNLILGGIHAYN